MLWMRTSGFAKSSSTAQFSYVNYLSVSGLCKALWNTQMRLPIVFKFIIYIKSFPTWLVQNKLNGTLAALNVKRCCSCGWGRWKNSGDHLPTVAQCLAPSSLLFCPNAVSHPHMLVHLGFHPGGAQSIPSYTLDCNLPHSPHLVNEPLSTLCVSGSIHHQYSQS